MAVLPPGMDYRRLVQNKLSNGDKCKTISFELYFYLTYQSRLCAFLSALSLLSDFDVSVTEAQTKSKFLCVGCASIPADLKNLQFGFWPKNLKFGKMTPTDLKLDTYDLNFWDHRGYAWYFSISWIPFSQIADAAMQQYQVLPFFTSKYSWAQCPHHVNNFFYQHSNLNSFERECSKFMTGEGGGGIDPRGW